MDNLAHTLVGASLAESGLKRWTPLGTAALVAGANLPDVDALVSFWGQDAALLHRRGWTHGVLALALQPFLLAGLLLAYDRWVRRRRQPDQPPARLGPLVALSAIAVLSHPLLDWLNNYGVRWLMPFDGRWFYGDALFIVDPWFWAVGAAAPVLAHSATWRGKLGWSLLGLLTSAVVLVPGMVPWPAKLLWGALVVALVTVRARRDGSLEASRVGQAAVATLALYSLSLWVSSRVAEARAADWLRDQGATVLAAHAGPLPANPLAWDVIVEVPDAYRFFTIGPGGSSASLVESTAALPRRPPDAIVQAALSRPGLEGLRGWLRFPSWQVEESASGWRVTIRDVRYARGDRPGLGSQVVEVTRAEVEQCRREGRCG